MTLTLSSSAFDHGGEIPTQYTCDGIDVSPPLAWSGAPDGTKSFALIVDDPDAPDPDAPRVTWVHWVLCNLPAASDALLEDASGGELPVGTVEGRNDWKRTGYGGPCPPIGRHRYFFRLYALDADLQDPGHPTKQVLEQAMSGHVLGEAVLMGTYSREHARQ